MIRLVGWILGMMKKKKKKNIKLRGKEIYWGVWLGGFVRVKLVESICFLFGPTKMFSSQI